MMRSDNEVQESGPASADRGMVYDPGNPYIGPRPYRRDEPLPGREREVEEVLSRLRSDRVLLIHSPSGAGKTSLLQSAVMPALEPEYTILSTAPVGLIPLGAETERLHPNRYINTTLLSLAAKFPESTRSGSLPHQALPQALDTIRAADPNGADAMYLLVLDQFEEVLSLDASDWEAKKEFFAELGFVLRDERVAAIVAIREEWLGELEPYARLLPTRLARRYRLEPLNPSGALEAIRRPAESHGVNFSQPAADRLLNSLLQVRVAQAGGPPAFRRGTTVEPLLLQVVCYSLWDRLRPGWEEGAPLVIRETDVGEAAEMDSALSLYYAQQVSKAATVSAVEERHLRDWMEKKLITPAGLRNHVLLEGETAGGLPVPAVQALEGTLLVRRDTVRSITWFELIHDRFVGPVQQNNAEWRARFTPPLTRKAELWIALGRRKSELLKGNELNALSRRPVTDLTPEESEYVAASMEAQRRRRAARRRKILTWLGGSALVLAGLGLYLAWQYQRSNSVKLEAYRWVAAFQLDMQAELQSRTYGVVPPPAPSQAAIDWPSQSELIPLLPLSPAYGETEQRQDSVQAAGALAAGRPAAFPGMTVTVGGSRAGAAAATTVDALQGRLVHTTAGRRMPNSLAFSSDVPLPVIRAIALSMLIDGSPPAKIRLLPEGSGSKQVSLSFEPALRAWPPLTTEQILRLTGTAGGTAGG